MKYTEKVQEIVARAVEELKACRAHSDELGEKYRREEIGGNAYREQLYQIEQKAIDIRTKWNTELEQIRQAYMATVEEGSLVDGSMLHEDAKLLEMGLTLTEWQYTKLVEKHRGNQLMTQLLRQYGERHPGLYADMPASPEIKKSEFNGYINAAKNVVSVPDTMQAALFETGTYIPSAATEDMPDSRV